MKPTDSDGQSRQRSGYNTSSDVLMVVYMKHEKQHLLVKVACTTPAGFDNAVLSLVANGWNHFSSFFHDNIRKWRQHSRVRFI